MGRLSKGYDPNRAHGGPRANSGRDPNWVKKKCQDLIDKHKLLEFLAEVASGEYKEAWVSIKTEKTIMRPVDAETRMKAINMLLDRGYGKPLQDMQLSGTVGGKMIIQRPGKTNET